jgi:iron complex outermembrane receptor protein
MKKNPVAFTTRVGHPSFHRIATEPLRRSSCSLAALAALVVPVGAWAQAAAAPDAPASAVAATATASSTLADANAPQVVTVTGNGRAQQLQNVPIAVQVVTSEQIDKLAASNLGDMNGYIPGLAVNADQPTQPFFALRGIGTGDFGIGTDAPVGVYVDGVYTGKTGGALLNFNDVKRIEVLKGPQGTLFGRNSAGGAVSIVTNDPSGTFAANGLVRLGNYGTRHVEGMVNAPLNDDFALRVSATGQFSDGWQRDAATGQRERGDHAWGTRAALAWSPSTETRTTLSWEHEDLDQRALPVIGLLATPAFGADPSTYRDPRKAPLMNDAIGDKESRRFDGGTLRIEHSLPWAEFTSTTAVRHFNSLNRADSDGTNVESSFLETGNVESNTTWQQEFKLAGHNDLVDWLGGASFFHEKACQASEIHTNTDSLDTLFGNVAGIAPFATINGLAQAVGVDGIDLSGQSWQENMINVGSYKSFALYGDAIWHVAAGTDLTTGLRLTRDEKQFSWYSPLRSAPGVDPQLAALNAGDFFPTLVGAGALSQADADALQGLVSQNQLINGQGANTAPLQVRRSWTNASPRVVIDHHFGADTMLYASVTRGYQSGGFNALSVNGGYAPETVTSYEIGAKGQVAAANLTYSAALFHYDYDHLQSLTLVTTGTSSGLPAYEVSSSAQKANGLDVDLRWKPTPSLSFYGAAELLDQTFKTNVASDGTDLHGQPVGTPKLTATLGTDYRVPVAGGMVDATLQGAYTGATRCNADAAAQGTCLRTPSFQVGSARTRIDARLGWDSAPVGTPRWGVALVVDNLTDRRYVTSVNYIAASLGSPYATISPPRFVAVEFRGSL